MRKLSYTLLLAALVLVTGCRDLTVENLNDPDTDRALAQASDLQSLIEGANTDVLSEVVGLWGVHMDGLADQMTSTNKYLSFWDFTHEPRLRLNNRTTYADAVIFDAPWSNLNSAIFAANQIIGKVDIKGESIVLEDGTDISQKLLAGAYFARGVARGYIGMIYDQGYLVEADSDLSALEPQPYSAVLAGAVSDLDKAMEIADGIGAGFLYDFLPGGSNSYDLAAFKEISNGFAARFLISEARTKAEADSWPGTRWDAIIARAEAGPGTAIPAFSPATVANTFYPNGLDWSSYQLSDGSGYLPTDIKALHLLDPTYPDEYPTTDGVVLDPAQSDDPRIAYYNYTPNFGFLNAARDRSLFSNYLNWRMFSNNDWYGVDGYPTPIITGSEMQYIIAEAKMMKGDMNGAAQAMNNSPAGSVPMELEYALPSQVLGLEGIDFGDAQGLAGNMTFDGTESADEMAAALHKEYSVELDLLGGIGLQWYFMRRHDMLQTGTALHYPVPGGELEITGAPYYTFGGASYAGQEGTASGANSWRENDVNASASRAGAQRPLDAATFGPVQSDREAPATGFYGADGRSKRQQ